MSDAHADLTGLPARIVHGDEEAARLLVDACTPLVVSICRSHRPRQLAVDDLAQEVFLTMFARLDRYQEQPGVPFTAWLSRLAVNVCLDALRAEKRRPRLALGAEASAWLDSLTAVEDTAPASAAAAKETVDALLAELPPQDRLVLTLVDLEERPMAEVAAMTGWSVSATKVRAFRARQKLQAIATTMRKDVHA